MTTTTPIQRTLVTWYGRIYLFNCGTRVEIHNLVAGRRTLISLDLDDHDHDHDDNRSTTTRIRSFCTSSTRFVFLILNDESGTVFGLKEDDDGSYVLYSCWKRRPPDGYYCHNFDVSIPSSVISITTDRLIDDRDCFSHFGISFVEDADPQCIGTHDDRSGGSIIGCTEKHLYIVHGSDRSLSSLNAITRINLAAAANTSNKLPAGGAIIVLDNFLPPVVSIRRIECGYAHVVVLDTIGSVYTFGIGTRGELGRLHDPSSETVVPKVVPALLGVRIRHVAVGGWHTVAVTEFGDAYVWGWNNDCQLGYDKDSNSTIPEPRHLEFTDDVGVKSVACGSRHTVFLLENGDVYGCGWNGYYQLCGGSSDNDRKEPRSLFKIDLHDKTPVTAIDAGGMSTVFCYCTA